jgi:hypothetical protein
MRLMNDNRDNHKRTKDFLDHRPAFIVCNVFGADWANSDIHRKILP